MPSTLLDKIWDGHVAADLGGGWCLLHIDRHLLHDLSGTAGLTELGVQGLRGRNPELTFTTPDHAASTAHGRAILTDGTGPMLRASLRTTAAAERIRFFDLGEAGQASSTRWGRSRALPCPGPRWSAVTAIPVHMAG